MSSSALRAQRRKLRKEKLNKGYAPNKSGLLNAKQREHSEQSENQKEKEIWGSSRPNPCVRYYNGFNDGLSDTEIIKCIRQKNVRRFRPAIY